jgi:murein DD-endopeptidase MepM/ murein hydrolase activator NlpD
MRLVGPIVICAVVMCAVAAPAQAEDLRLQWPLRPEPVVTRPFDAPRPDWRRGHRGVDLAGVPGQPVYAAGPGTVVFAGRLAGRAVVSVQHPGGLRTSYEPVEASVRPGQSVAVGSPLGRLIPGHAGCPGPACLHWGAMWGPAQRADYVDPVGLLAVTPIRLKPLGTVAPQARG